MLLENTQREKGRRRRGAGEEGRGREVVCMYVWDCMYNAYECVVLRGPVLSGTLEEFAKKIKVLSLFSSFLFRDRISLSLSLSSKPVRSGKEKESNRVIE